MEPVVHYPETIVNNTDWKWHSEASALVKMWARRIRPVADHADVRLAKNEPMHSLSCPARGFPITANFSKIKGHPELMAITSTNYRFEHEVHGVYSIEDARAFFRDLKKNGFNLDTVLQ